MNGFIFDLDGVIVDTAKYHYLSWKELANELNFIFTEKDNERLKGVSRVDSLDILLEIGKIKKNKEEKEFLMEKKNKLFLEFVSKIIPSDALPNVKEWFEFLKTKNKKIALGSSSKNADLVLTKLNLKSYFDVIVDGNHISKAKPNPEIFEIGYKKMGLKPSECVVFEDAEAGVEAAINAGCKVVGIGDSKTLSRANFIISGFKNMDFNNLYNKICNLK